MFSVLDFLMFEGGLLGSPETCLGNYHSVLHNFPEHISHMTIWWCGPWFDSALSGSEQCGLVRCASVLHNHIYDSLTYLSTKFKEKYSSCIWLNIVKGKAVPLQAWSGPESSRKLRFPDFMITAQEGGKVVSLTHRPHLPPGNPPGTHFC